MKINKLILIFCFTLLSCNSNRIHLKENNENFELTVTNTENIISFIPKLYLEVLSNNVSNNQFEIISSSGEKAYFHGIYNSAEIPDYNEAPERYIQLHGKETINIIVSVKNNYFFTKDYDFFYIKYNGFLGKSNKLKVKKKTLQVKK